VSWARHQLGKKDGRENRLLKKILLLSIVAINVYAQDALSVKEYRTGLYDLAYLELIYDINQPVFVSDELAEGESRINLENDKVTIYYYPRGDTIRMADEYTKWPPVIRKIMPGEILAVRINFRHILSKAGIDISAIDEINLIITDIIFLLDDNSSQTFFYPEFIHTRMLINSERIILKKRDGYWEKVDA
jgi:hypothetical protein